MKEHKVTFDDRNFDIEQFGHQCMAFDSLKMLLDISDGVLDGMCTFRARFFSSHKNVKVGV